MRFLIALLILSILGNIFGAYVLYKFFQKDKILRETMARLEEKTRALDTVNRQLDRRLVFVHHSCGRNWLNDGLREALMGRGVAVRSLTYGCPVGEETDMRHWVPKFRDNLSDIIAFDQVPATPYAGTEENDIIMFKSCYPNSDIVTDGEGPGSPTDSVATLTNYYAVMNTLAPIMAGHEGKTFIYVTAPPLVSSATTPENAARARKFNTWVKTDFVTQYRERTGQDNLFVFDFFGVLADSGSNTLKAEYQRSSGDSHPNTAGNRAATKAFLAFLDEHGL